MFPLDLLKSQGFTIRCFFPVCGRDFYATGCEIQFVRHSFVLKTLQKNELFIENRKVF
jgi:hypothetical protein